MHRPAEAAARPPLPPGTRFVRLMWTDLAGLRRARVISASTWADPAWAGVGLAEVCLSLQTLCDAPAWPAEAARRPGPAVLVPGAGARVVPLGGGGGGGSHHAMVACDVLGAGRRPAPLPTCPRSALVAVVDALGAAGLTVRLGFEVEFRLLARGGGGCGCGDGGRSPGLLPPTTTTRHAAAPAATGPATYALASTLDAAAPILDAIADGLAAAGIELLHYHGESGTGAFEVVTGPADPVASVDALLYTRQIIATAASAAGYDATFAPRPAAAATEGNLGQHVHISVQAGGSDGGAAATAPPAAGAATGPTTPTARAFLAGILHRLDGLTALTAGSPSSFERRQPGMWAGAHRRWAVEDKEAPLRFIPGPPERVEVKALDAGSNPYLALAALLAAGLAGVEGKEELEPPAAPVLEEDAPAVDASTTRPPPGSRLPQTVGAALAALRRPEVQDALSRTIPTPLLEVAAAVREADARAAEAMAAEAGGVEGLRGMYRRVYS